MQRPSRALAAQGGGTRSVLVVIPEAPADAAAWLARIGEEHRVVARDLETSQLDAIGAAILAATRVFTCGAGRSGLALRMVAMRLMHLGLAVHVVGETTAPAIEPGDLLIAASGSGRTASVLAAVEKARSIGARVASVTTDAASPMAEAAELGLTLHAAAKQDRSGAASAQYAGALFEQSLLLVFDALFEALARRRGEDAQTLWSRHANLE